MMVTMPMMTAVLVLSIMCVKKVKWLMIFENVRQKYSGGQMSNGDCKRLAVISGDKP